MFSNLTWSRRISEMRNLLALDRRLLLAGAIDELARLDGRRVVVEAKLYEMPREVAEREQLRLAELREMAKRNQRLLSAYLEGARRATKRLMEIHEAVGEIGAYLRDGTKLGNALNQTTKDFLA